ncbi:MAG TPA: M1 family metallopeptidase [Candidatus Saccharimonadales bacterium]|nr:M1 family metallopeptidase [Candidatus Saccharimonadales bacterium]
MNKKIKKIRLSDHVVPKEYFITIHPDIPTFTFKGEEEIVVDLKKPTNNITLHADELEISEVFYNGTINGSLVFDSSTETVSISFPKQLPKGIGKLSLKFTGILNDKMRGFYKSKYQIDGKEHHMAVTQFESTDARRTFPSFDEPSQKAVFHINLIVPDDHTAISNTIESEIKEHSAGFKVVSFEPTPKMSTYLLAFIVGKFEHIEKKAKDGTLVRVFVTPGKKKQAEFALDIAAKTISFFSDYFQIAYPLPVIDLIAIPDFAAGAMENWGAVTYRETALLVDDENTSTINKQWVALVIAHEFAHQWFGNLVTMEWWTHLWLNEGFASYIEYLAVDHIFPQWDIWTQFVNMDHARALELDGLENTHPIEVEVNNPTEISEIFDAVSYSKGASIIRMLAEYLGEDIFRKGLQVYLKKHSYSNASTSDLWNALESVSKKPVGKIMNNWTQKAGYPLITIDRKYGKAVITQSRFFSSIQSQTKSTDSTLWEVPVGIITSSSKTPKYYLMDKKTLTMPQADKSDWVKLNSGETSLIRVRYSDTDQMNLLKAIERGELSTIDRFGVIRDVLVLAEAGKASTVHAMSTYPAYKNEQSYIVWSEIASQLARLGNLLSEEREHELFEKFAREIFKIIGTKVGWEKRADEDHSQTLLRSVVISSLGKYGDNETISIAQDMFNKMLRGERKIESDLRGVVYYIVAKYGNEKTYSDLLKLYKESTLQEEKDRIFRALCSFRDKNLLEKSLEFGFSDEVRTQDSYKSIYFIFANSHGRDLAWDFLRNHWKEIVKRYSGGHLFSRFAEPIEFFTKKSEAQDVEKFFKENAAPGAERTIKQVLEKIYSNDEWLKRDLISIKKFLISNDPQNVGKF